MSQKSKVNPTLRSNIIESLTLSSKTNAQLQASFVANAQAYSTRAIQEATQKLTALGVITKTGNLFSLNLASTATASV